MSSEAAILLDAKIEAELPAEEAAELLAGIGQDELRLDQLARVGSPHPGCRRT